MFAISSSTLACLAGLSRRKSSWRILIPSVVVDFLLDIGKLRRMCTWLGKKPRLSCDSTVNFHGRNGSLFYDAVRDNYRRTTMKEIQHSIVNSLKPYAQLINSISQ